MKKTLLLMAFGICVTAFAQDPSFTTQFIATNGADRAIVDMNNDFLDDIVSVNSNNVQIFYQQVGGGFTETNIGTTNANYTPSWSLAAADYDGNGYTDLLYGGGSGVTFMRANSTGTGFTEISGNEFVFSQRSNFIDINNDGFLDAFVCHDVEPNVYYINDGSGNLSFIQGGLGDYPTGGNYGSVWIDFDNDRDMDMFIAKCGGDVPRRTNQLFQNNGNGTYTDVAGEAGMADPMQTWSSAWGDYDNDGDMDAFIGASSGSTHKLMRNNGDGTFTDVTAESGIEALSATGIENATHDFNNDGILDIASNGNILIGKGDLTFTIFQNQITSSNGAFGDLNNDGFIDAFLDQTIYWNTPNSNNWFKLNTIGTSSNIHGLGARVEIETPSGTQIRDVRSGEGFRYMSSLNTHFGLGAETTITTLRIYWPSGLVDVIQNPPVNQALTVTEGETLSLEDSLVNSLILFPNPVDEKLRITASTPITNAVYSIFDVHGKRVANAYLTQNAIDVAALSPGQYILRIMQGNNIMTQRFIKK